MAWIESHQGLATHPKTRKLVRKLGIGGPLAVGLLHYLWWWALDHAQDGEITRYDEHDIADACSWNGDAEEFHNALIYAGFIDVVDVRRFIHDWHDYAGKLIEIRNKDAERKRKSREKTKVSDGHPTDIHGTSEGRRTESIRDLNLDLNQEEEEKPDDPKTAMDAYFYSFKKYNYTGHISDYVHKLMKRGMTDAFVREIFLEMGARGIGPDERYMKKLAEDWISKGIYTRVEASRRRELQLVKGGQTDQPKRTYQSKQESQTERLMREIKEGEAHDRTRDQEAVFDHQQHVSELPYR